MIRGYTNSERSASLPLVEATELLATIKQCACTCLHLELKYFHADAKTLKEMSAYQKDKQTHVNEANLK